MEAPYEMQIPRFARDDNLWAVIGQGGWSYEI